MYPISVQNLIDELGRLPGIGPRSAQRIAFYLLKLPAEDALRLASAIRAVKEQVSWCRRCFNIAEAVSREEAPECAICLDPRRDPTVVCVVQEPRNVLSLERLGQYRGRYHVLQGAISHLDGIGADKLRIRELLERIEAEGITEVILGTSTSIEGEATALYLSKALKELPVKVTLMARGLPAGGDLEYADEVTLGRALEGRREI